MVRKKVPSELERAEIKLRTLLERRDALNAQANGVRADRDQLHDQRRALSAQIRPLKEERDALVREMRVHKAARNELQGKAKRLIELRRKVRTKVASSVSGDLAALRQEIARIEMDQQTRPMELDEENELLAALKARMRQVRDLEQVKGEQDRIHKDVREIDAAIDDLFRRADEEHARVLTLSEQANGVHAHVEELSKAASVLVAEADKKHAEYLEVRSRADEAHQRVVELRGKVVAIRGEERAEQRETRKILKQQKQRVRTELLDEKKLDEYADQAVESLLKKGKVEIRG